jgi:phosphomannomutase/phosphoglucomutase
VSTLGAESTITLNVKETISEARRDKIVLSSVAMCIVGLIATFMLMWQELVVEARQQAVNFHYGLNMKVAASRVDAYLDQYQQSLDQLVSQTTTIDDLQVLENKASALLTEAEAVYLVDPELQRHKQQLGFAAMQMVRLTMNGESVTPRAIKIDQQWKILISRALSNNGAAITGVILLQLPMTGMQSALRDVDISDGTLELQQLVPNRSNIVLVSLGQSEPQNPAPGFGSEVFDTGNALWKISFTPSEALIATINKQLPPFWLFFAAALIAVVVALYLLTIFRARRKQMITAIFIENHNAEDALFAPAIDAYEDRAKNKAGEPEIEQEPLINTVEEPQVTEEPKPVIEEPQPSEHPESAIESQTLEKPEPIEEAQLQEDSKPIEEPASAEDLDSTELPALELEEELLEQPKSTPTPELEPVAELEDNLGDPNFAVPDVVFRDYDIRGIAGTEITPEFASRLGKAIGSIILKNGHSAIYIGRDGRLSSPQLCEAMQNGLLSTGCNVIDLGEITTPILNFAVHHSGQSSCGIMVTASHNPAYYNGFKIIIKGQVIAGPTLQLLKPMLDAAEFRVSDGGQYFQRDITAQYVRHIIEESSIDRSFKIAVDGGNAVAGPVALKLFDSLGCMAFPLHCEVDGRFPNHEPNPADEKNLQELITKVKDVKADLGFAFDGDGDRIVVISPNGEIVWPDQLMMIFARDILARNPGADIVFDVKSSKRLAETVRKHSGRPVMCKTGHAHVRKAVHHNNAPLGGEFSGHIFFNDRWKGFDDGVYAAVRLLEILCAQQDYQTLDSMVAGFSNSSYTPEILIPVDEAEKFSLIDTLVAGCQFNGAQVITLDGLRVEYPSGWGLIRASNTSANLTLRFEADDDKGLEDIRQRFRRELTPFINHIEDYI